MINYKRVVVNKIILKRCLTDNEDISKSLSRFIDNSIEARKGITTSENPCEVSINIFQGLIAISDNSGGIDSKITEEDIFRIGIDAGNEIFGLGMKKSLFRLGNKMDIISNRRECSRRFFLDINFGGEELISQSEDINYNPKIYEGTSIFISDLDDKINKEIVGISYIDYVILKLGRMYSKFIEKGELVIYINDRKVRVINIKGKKLGSCKVLGDYEVDLYKGSKGEVSGIDIFINNYMIYDREKGKKEVKWSSLTEQKHTYRDCIVEINYHGERSRFIEDKEALFAEVIKFIKYNKVHFKSKTITIQYEMDLDKVDALKEYYDEKTAKAIGIMAFDKLYIEFLYNNMRN